MSGRDDLEMEGVGARSYEGSNSDEIAITKTVAWHIEVEVNYSELHSVGDQKVRPPQDLLIDPGNRNIHCYYDVCPIRT